MNMRCNDTRELIGAYIDGELDLVRSLDIEGHLHECSDCSRDYEAHHSLHRMIRGGELYFDAPAGLERRIRKTLNRANRSASGASTVPWRWFIVAASAAAVLVILFYAGLILTSQPGSDLIARDVATSHIRSLEPGHLYDVESNDTHNVKPWFNGKVDFSPPVKDLTAADFVLKGGRLDYIDNRQVAVLVYGRRQHSINLYIWPSDREAGTSEEVTARQGYNMIHWSKDGMAFWAVSDLNVSDLRSFVKAQQE
jgi:anti-sigma factor RsiW